MAPARAWRGRLIAGSGEKGEQIGKPSAFAMLLDQPIDGIAPGAVTWFAGDNQELIASGAKLAKGYSTCSRHLLPSIACGQHLRYPCKGVAHEVVGDRSLLERRFSWRVYAQGGF